MTDGPNWGLGPTIIPIPPGQEEAWAGIEARYIGDGTVIPRSAKTDAERAPVTRSTMPDLLTKREAATYLRMSERTFERQVMANITRIQIGGRQLIEFEELERWLESRKVSPSSGTRARRRTSFASDTAAAISRDPRAKQILASLEYEPPRSTPRLFPVDKPRRK